MTQEMGHMTYNSENFRPLGLPVWEGYFHKGSLSELISVSKTAPATPGLSKRAVMHLLELQRLLSKMKRFWSIITIFVQLILMTKISLYSFTKHLAIKLPCSRVPFV